MGLSAKPAELLNIEKVKRWVMPNNIALRFYNYTLFACLPRDNIQVLRRFTGGGTVVVDDSTIFTSFIMNVSTYSSISPHSLIFM